MPRFARASCRRLMAVAVLSGTLVSVSGPAQALPSVLTWIETEVNGQHGAEGLNGAQAVAVSPDGLHVYVGGTDGDSLAVFSRNPSTGSLQFEQVLEDGAAGVTGLNGVIDVAISPDGKHVYTAAVTSAAVAIFSREAVTGLLTYVGVKRETDADVVGLSQASGVTVSPDNNHVYATGRFSDGVVAFSRNTSSGALTFLEAEIGGSGGVPTSVNGPEDVIVSPNGTHVFVASGAGNAVNVFTRTAGTGLLTYFDSKVDGAGGVNGLSNASKLTISADGLNVYAAGNGDNAVAVFTRTVASGALNFVEAEINGVNGVAGLSGANGVAVSPGGEHVYASGVGSDAVVVFSRGANGALTYVQNVAHNGVAGPALDVPRSLVLAPNGGQLYVVASSSDALTTLTRNANDGTLTYLSHLTNTPRTIGLEQAISVEVSPTGNTVYVSSVAESAVAIYQRDAATGVITFTQSYVDEVGSGFQLITGARAVAVSPDSLSFYVIGATDNAIVAVLRHQTTGASLGVVSQLIDGTGGVDGMDSPAGVVVSPDNKHVYVVTGGNDPADPEDAVTAFTRSQANGALTFAATIKDGQAGANALNGANAIAFNASGSSLYVAAKGDNAVTLFARDVSTGLLTFVQATVDGAGGITSLGGANDVALSPDGLHLYATSATDDSVTVFSRQLPVGQLTYVEHETASLDNPTEVAVTPDGRYVMVTSQDNDSLVVFERDAGSGGLTLLDVLTDELMPQGINGLDQTAALTVSADGKHLYATGMGDDAVVAFAIGSLLRQYVPLVLR